MKNLITAAVLIQTCIWDLQPPSPPPPPWVGTEFFNQVMLMTRFRTKLNYFLCIGQQLCFLSLFRSMTTVSAFPLLKKFKTLVRSPTSTKIRQKGQIY